MQTMKTHTHPHSHSLESFIPLVEEITDYKSSSIAMYFKKKKIASFISCLMLFPSLNFLKNILIEVIVDNQY